MSTTIYNVRDRRDVFFEKGGQKMFVALEIPKEDPLLQDVATYEALVWGDGNVPSTWTIHTPNWTPSTARECIRRDNAKYCAVGIEATICCSHTVFVCYE